MKRFNIIAIACLSGFLILSSASAKISQQVSNQPTSILANNTLTLEKLRQLAQAVTVKVFSSNKGGSGVLISRQGRTYTILTNAHVISAKATHNIQTPDGKTHNATVISRGDSLSGNDLAVLQFQAQENYQIVPLATNSNLSENQEVLAAGFPDDSKELVITNGKISLVSPQPLIGGYQIGYTNEIRQGMSGGTLLNQEGKLIGINGLHNNAILNETYTYQNGTIPNAEEIQRLKKFSFAVPIQTLAKVAPNLAVIPAEWQKKQQAEKPPVGNTLADKINNVNNIAQKITVRIDSKNNGNGSGVIIAQQGQTYYVATARHVVEKSDSYEILTSDGERYAVQPVQPENFNSKGTDAALIKFTSNKNYTIATISKENRSALDNTNQKKMLVFVSGFPAVDRGKHKLTAGFLTVKEDLFLDVDSNEVPIPYYVNNLLNLGHELRYSNLSLPGMSGGAVLNIMGEVIGINLGADPRKLNQIDSNNTNQSPVKIGFGLGIPSNTLLGLATKAGLNKELLRLVNNSNKSQPQTIQYSEINSLWEHPLFAIQKPAANANDYELLQYANKIWRIGNFAETADILQQIVKSQPNYYQAHFVLSLVLTNEKDKYKEALAAFEKVTTLQPNFYEVWKYKSNVLMGLEKYPLALAAVDKAIEYSEKDDKDFSLYLFRSSILIQLNRYPEALEAINEAIKIQDLEINYLIRTYVLYQLEDYQAALADSKQLITRQPDNANNYVLQGDIHVRLKKHQAALADYKQAIKLEPDNYDAYVSRGNLYVEIKDNKAALADYKQAIKLEPDNAKAYYWRGYLHKDLKDYQAALADANQAIKFQPNNSNYYVLRASVYKELNKYKEALVDYNQAIKLQPNYVKYSLRGNFHRDLKDYQAALTDYDQAIKLQPNAVNAYQQRGNVHFLLNNYQKALTDYNQAITLQPDNADNYVSRGIVRKELNDYQAALTDYNQAIKLQPNNSRYYVLRGNVHKELKNYQAALTDYNQAIKLQPNNASAYYQRGDLSYLLRDYQAALADYNQVIKLQPNNANAYNQRGVVRYFLIDYQAALTDLNQAIKLQPNDAKSYYWRGFVRKELKDYQAALADCNQTIKLQPNDAVGYYCRGVVYQKQGDDNAALSEYAQALVKNEKFAAANTKIGYIKYEKGDVEGAIQEWQKAVQVDSDLTGAQLALAVVLHSRGEQQKALNMAQATLRLDKTLADVEVLKQNLWGTRLIAEGEKLLSHPNIQALRVKK
ncbi:MAG: tetratricopeptide repeat protein [Brasilonema angustatum HA4187-MV1]|jgi:tetratricopeptide (TPR) repeat protein/S1-C subfamily serine protease|nr:tetratricopeptide repeat protein [Brasilonema angustatum HA4187-MV1]